MTKIEKGIDVSGWQGNIDFDKVKKSGITFVIIKAGGSDDGFYTDSYFESNYKKAVKAGLKVGSYYIVGSDFYTANKGIKNALHYCEIIAGKTFDYPCFLDLELTSPSQKIGATVATKAFCKTVSNHNYKTGVYASSVAGFIDRLDTEQLTDVTKWVAQYSGDKPNYPTDYMIWQYSDCGMVDGINGFVDMNISFNVQENEIKKEDNSKIEQIQKWLNANYNTNIDTDGIYGVCTHTALVMAYQTELNKQFNANLEIDGIFGNYTKSASVDVGFNAVGNITKILQSLLICKNYLTGECDGIFGSETLSSVLHFQKDNNLETDGIAGANTFEKLCKGV